MRTRALQIARQLHDPSRIAVLEGKMRIIIGSDSTNEEARGEEGRVGIYMGWEEKIAICGA